jgi:hypothetical protein
MLKDGTCSPLAGQRAACALCASSSSASGFTRDAALICLGGVLIGVGGIASCASNVCESTTQSLVDRVHRCVTVLDDTARLFCYDSLSSRQPAKAGRTRLPFRGH